MAIHMQRPRVVSGASVTVVVAASVVKWFTGIGRGALLHPNECATGRSRTTTGGDPHAPPAGALSASGLAAREPPGSRQGRCGARKQSR